MAKRHVAAHTNEVGNYIVSARHSWFYNPSNTNNTLSISGTLRLRHSIRSEHRTGGFHPEFREFRMPTPYTRVIARLENVQGISGPFRRGNITYLLNGTDNDGRHPAGLRFGTDLHYNQTSGLVKVSSHLVNRAKAEAMSKVSNQKINLSVAAAEAVKTIDFVSQKITSLVILYRLLRQRKFSQAYKILQRYRSRYYREYYRKRKRPKKYKESWTADRAWLEWWYAFMPLVYDIWGGIEQLKNGFRSKDKLFSVERTCSAPLDPGDFVGISTLSGKTVTGTAEESVRIKLWGSIKDGVSYANSLGLTNPFTVLWELTPFSFVIDWLVPIGTWLDSFTADVGVDFVSGIETRLVTADVTGVHHAPLVNSIGFPMPGAKLPSARAQVFAMNRIVLLDWPQALPYWKNPLSTHHLITALALIKATRR